MVVGGEEEGEVGRRITKLFFANRPSVSCQVSHQELPKTKSFLYQQTVQLKQSEIRLRGTECGKAVIENILQRHVLRSVCPPAEKQKHTLCSRIF